jgi:hypothetical protein
MPRGAQYVCAAVMIAVMAAVARRSLGPPVSLETPTTSGIASAIAIAFLLAMLLLRPFTRVSSLDVVETAAPAVVHRGR